MPDFCCVIKQLFTVFSLRIILFRVILFVVIYVRNKSSLFIAKYQTICFHCTGMHITSIALQLKFNPKSFQLRCYEFFFFWKANQNHNLIFEKMQISMFVQSWKSSTIETIQSTFSLKKNCISVSNWGLTHAMAAMHSIILWFYHVVIY